MAPASFDSIHDALLSAAEMYFEGPEPAEQATPTPAPEPPLPKARRPKATLLPDQPRAERQAAIEPDLILPTAAVQNPPCNHGKACLGSQDIPTIVIASALLAIGSQYVLHGLGAL